MGAKLTEAQVATLAALPVEIIMWGGKPFAGMPAGIRNRSTLWALYRRGLAVINYRGSTEIWRPSESGHAALARARGEQP